MHYTSLHTYLSQIPQCRHKFLLDKESHSSASSKDNQQPLFSETATPLFSTLKTPLLFYSHHIPQSSNSCFLSSFQECLCVLILVSSEGVNALRSTLTPSDKPPNCWSSFPFLALSVLAAPDHLNSRFSCAFPWRPTCSFFFALEPFSFLSFRTWRLAAERGILYRPLSVILTFSTSRLQWTSFRSCPA